MLSRIRRWIAIVVAFVVTVLTLGRVAVDRSGQHASTGGHDTRGAPTRTVDG